jgi:hypothetical protein
MAKYMEQPAVVAYQRSDECFSGAITRGNEERIEKSILKLWYLYRET